MMRRYRVALCAVGLLGLAGCGFSAPDSKPPSTTEELGSTGLSLSIDYKGESDVGGFRYRVETCAGELVVHWDKNLEDLSLPGMIPAFDNAPFDAHSSHLFSDHFMVLPAGCYNVRVQPIRPNGDVSQDCSVAHARGIEVYKGQTTEILLISQCKGPNRGGLDVIAALNHSPVLKTLRYEPSKFVFECEETVVCATAYDPDGDPLEFVWERLDDGYVHSFEVLEPRHVEGKYVTECIKFVPLWYGSYDIKVSVYDLFFDSKTNKYVRAEDYVGKHSHASLVFPIHTNWDIEHECYDPNSKTFHKFEGVREIVRAPDCRPIWPHEFYCSTFYWDNTATTCPGGKFAPETVYPICELNDDDHDDYMIE